MINRENQKNNSQTGSSPNHSDSNNIQSNNLSNQLQQQHHHQQQQQQQQHQQQQQQQQQYQQGYLPPHIISINQQQQNPNMHSIQVPPQPQRILPNQALPHHLQTFRFNSCFNPNSIPEIKDEHQHHQANTTTNMNPSQQHHHHQPPNNSNFHKFKLSNSTASTSYSTSQTNLNSSGGIPMPGNLHRSNSVGGLSSTTSLSPHINTNNNSNLLSAPSSSTSTNTTPNSDYPNIFSSILGHSPNMASGIFQSPASTSSSSSLNVPPISPNSPQSPSSSNSSSMGSPNNGILSSPTSTNNQNINSSSSSVSTANAGGSTPRTDGSTTTTTTTTTGTATANTSPTKPAKPKPNRSPTSIARRREQHREHERQRRLKQKQLLSSATEVRQENTTLLLKVAQLKNELMMSQNSYAQMAQSYEDLMNNFNYIAFENTNLKKEIEHYKYGSPISQQPMFTPNIQPPPPPPAGAPIIVSSHSPPLPIVGPSISNLPHPLYIKKEMSTSPSGIPNQNNSIPNATGGYAIHPQQPNQQSIHLNQYGSIVQPQQQQQQPPLPPPPPSKESNISPPFIWGGNTQTLSPQSHLSTQFSPPPPPPNFHSSHNYDHTQ